MGKLVVLMVTAFIDMMGVLMVIPLLPFYAKRMLGHGPLWTALNAIGFGGSGAVVSLLVMSSPSPSWRVRPSGGACPIAMAVVRPCSSGSAPRCSRT